MLLTEESYGGSSGRLGFFLIFSESNSECRFFEDFNRKWIRNVRVENPGFLPTRS